MQAKAVTRGEKSDRTLLARGYIWGCFPRTVQFAIGELSIAANSSPLYRHISSNNIGMTAPVETRYQLAL